MGETKKKKEYKMPRRGRRAKKRRNRRRKKKDEAALRAEIRSAMITEKGNASPIALRLAWHSSGTYDAAKGLYGNNGARMRFEPEISDGANNGLDIMRRILASVVNNNPEVSISDIWTYAGKCAIEFTGGPTIPTILDALTHAMDQDVPPTAIFP